MTPSIIEQIKARIPVTEVAAQAGVQLRQEGAEWAGLCPFHSDSDPSFKVYPADDGTQRFHCFGCDATGDVIDFWARYRGVSNQVALQELAERAGLATEERARRPRPTGQKPPENGQSTRHIPADNASAPSAPPVAAGAVSPLEGMVRRAEDALQRHPEVQNFLHDKRRLSPDIIRRARLGYEPNQARVVIPVPGPDGRIERVRLYDWQKKSPGRKIIWGPGNGKPGLYPSWALQEGTLLLVEGELDALCAWSLGVPAITGTAGAKRFPKDRAQTLAGKRVIICYDVDQQGQDGALRAARALSATAARVQILKLPLEHREKGDPKDITDWVLAGGTREQLDWLIAGAPAYNPQADHDVDAGDGRDGLPVLEQLLDAPVDEDAVVPAGWRLRPDGLYEIKPKGDELKLVRALPIPLVVSARVRNLETGAEQVEVAFCRDGRWRYLVADRDQVADKNRIVRLAGRGLLVTSNNARAVVQYLADYEAANLEEIAERVVVSSCGLKRVGGEPVFIAGPRTISAAGVATADDDEDGEEEEPERSAAPVRFLAESDGDWQIVSALTPAGSAEEWLAAVRQAQEFPRVMLCLYAALVPPLQPVLDVPNFIVDLCDDTSVGKTTTLEVAASVWGRPQGDAGGLVKAWNQTKVFAERYASLMNHLPIFLDDSQTADHRTVAATLYLVANGVGRGRGAQKGGVQRTGHWRTVCLSTGEAPLTAATEFGGARARTITLWGSPFGRQPRGETVRELKAAVAANHGHAGPQFLQELLRIRDQWDKLRDLYRLRTRQLAEQHPGNVADRMARYLAALWVAGDLVHQLLGLPGDAAEAVLPVTSEVARGLDDSDYATRALEAVRSWAHAAMELFWEKGDFTRPAHEYLGVWRDADYQNERFVAFFPHKLKKFLTDQGFNYDAVLRQWKERGWIKAQSGMTYPIRYRDGRIRCVVLRWEAWQLDEHVIASGL